MTMKNENLKKQKPRPRKPKVPKELVDVEKPYIPTTELHPRFTHREYPMPKKSLWDRIAFYLPFLK